MKLNRDDWIYISSFFWAVLGVAVALELAGYARGPIVTAFVAVSTTGFFGATGRFLTRWLLSKMGYLPDTDDPHMWPG